MAYNTLSTFYPDPIASGIYNAYIESTPLVQLIVIGVTQDMKRREIAEALGIAPQSVNVKFGEFKAKVEKHLPSERKEPWTVIVK
jgi:hypothetical protein